MFNGEKHYKWPFSMVMLNYQRVPQAFPYLFAITLSSFCCSSDPWKNGNQISFVGHTHSQWLSRRFVYVTLGLFFTHRIVSHLGLAGPSLSWQSHAKSTANRKPEMSFISQQMSYTVTNIDHQIMLHNDFTCLNIIYILFDGDSPPSLSISN